MKNEITYTEINGINYPNLALPDQPKVNIGKYGQMRLDFLKKHRRGTYTTLLTEGRLSAHLSAIDKEQEEYIRHYDYFFNRCLSLISIAILYLK